MKDTDRPSELELTQACASIQMLLDRYGDNMSDKRHAMSRVMLYTLKWALGYYGKGMPQEIHHLLEIPKGEGNDGN